MAGLFGTFNIAKSGLSVTQSQINTTSHNIANTNTTGYTRQRAVSATTTPYGGNSKYDSLTVGQVGTGAKITSIERIRDSFIDYQVRNETGTSGYYTSMSETLSNVEDIFGEPSDTGIQELISEFFSSFQEVSKSPDDSDVKAVAIKKASALSDAINYTYNQLKKTCEDNQTVLEENVTDVNSYLDQINELNKQIKSVSAVGQTANDLMDKRDNLLDELSYKFGIKINTDSLDTINLSSREYPDSSFVKSDSSDTDYSRLSYVKSATAVKDESGNITGVTVEYYPLGNENNEIKSFTVEADNSNAQDLIDKLMQDRILIGNKDGLVGTSTIDPITNETTVSEPTTASELNKKIFQTYKYEKDSTGTAINNVDNNNVKGEIAGNQSVQETIQGYMKNLDVLAAGLAYSVNAIQVGSLDTANENLDSSELIFVTYDNDTQANTETDKGINASNIRINSDLISDPSLLNCNTTSSSGEGDGSRANAIANLSTLKMNLSNVGSQEDLTEMDRETFLNKIGITGFSDSDSLTLNGGSTGSTVDTYYKTIINNLGVSSQEATRQSDNQDTILGNLEEQRLSISGVSLDEEMTDLIQFQHAYQANAKIISTIDELLDVVINGLKS